MPLPLAIAGGAKAAAPWISKHLIELLIGGGWLVSKGLESGGKYGERGLLREEMRGKAKLGESSAEATKMLTRRSQLQTKEYTKRLTKIKEDERNEARNTALLQSYMQNQNNQMMMVMQAIQAMNQMKTSRNQVASPGSGMVSMMRGGY